LDFSRKKDKSFYSKGKSEEERVMKIHRENVKKYPELYRTRSIKQLNLKKDNANLFNDDVKNLENEKITENMLNYFFKHMQQKQAGMDQTALTKYGLKAYFFTTSFYRLFIGDLDRKYFLTKYKNVKHETKMYSGEGNTIFDKYQKVLFPVLEVYGPSTGHRKITEVFKLIVVDSIKKEIVLYDASRPRLNEVDDKGNYLKDPKENKHVQAIANYIEQEFYDKCYLNVEVFDSWRFRRAECTQTDNDDMTSLFVCYYAYVILKGLKQPFFNGKEIKKFTGKLKKMVKKAQM
jgi:hypothetical protein